MSRKQATPSKVSAKSARATARHAVRAAVLQAAEEIFGRRGFRPTKMTEIARGAGVAVGTLYNYFDSKEEIFEAILKARRGGFREQVEPALQSGSPLERLYAVTRAAFSHLDEHGAIFAVFVERGGIGELDLGRLGGKAAEVEYERFLGLIEALFEAAVAAGQVRGDVPITALVAAFSGAMNGAVYHWLKRKRRGRLRDEADRVVDLFLSGAKKGSKPR